MAEELQIVSRRPSHSPTLRDVAAVFFRHKRLLVISFAAVATAVLLYSGLFPSYQSEMKILVRRGRIDPAITPTPSSSPAFEHDEITEEELNSEVELLRDEDILRQVVIKTDLAKPTWFSRLTRLSDEERTEKAVRRLAKKLDVQAVRKSRLVTVAYSSSDPRRSAAVLDSLARAYLARHAELRRPAGQQSFFEQQEEKSRLELQQAQANLIAFTQKEGVDSAGLERDLALQKLSDAEAAELGLIASMAEVSERARSLEVRLRGLPERRIVQIRKADNPELLGKMKSKLLELELRRTELLTKFQPSYRLVQEVEQQIAQAKAAIAAEDLKPLHDETTEDNPEYEWAHSERLKAQVELAGLQERAAIARRQVMEYRADAQRLEEGAVSQHDLEQKVKSAEEKWLLYKSKREEARIGDALDEDGVLNVALAEEPRAPAIPIWSFWAAACFSFLGAGAFSTGVVFATDYFDPSFRTPEEVFAVLGSPVLACLPAGNAHFRGSEAS